MVLYFIIHLHGVRAQSQIVIVLLCSLGLRFISCLHLPGQCGLTIFDLWAIFQNCDNLQATSHKVMHKTTDSQLLKLKKWR